MGYLRAPTTMMILSTVSSRSWTPSKNLKTCLHKRIPKLVPQRLLKRQWPLMGGIASLVSTKFWTPFKTVEANLRKRILNPVLQQPRKHQ